jgi:hypothetical protein
VLILLCAVSFAVVVHQGADGGPADRPSDMVVGSWNSNGSCVVVSPSCVITTQHQGGSVGSTVVVCGTAYTVDAIIDHSTFGVRVARLAGANFTDYATLNTGGKEKNKTVVLGGFGNIRGAELATEDGTLWGYRWAGDNNTLTWATNRIDATVIVSGASHLQIDFDAAGKRATDYEGIPAMYDSGSGMFVYRNKTGWSLYGLCDGITALSGYEDSAYFMNPYLIGVKKKHNDASSAQKAYYSRASDYAEWANGAVAALEADAAVVE